MNRERNNIMKTTITPEYARELLSNNQSNRAINKNNLKLLVRTILDDKWIYNGQSIVVGDNGVLLDGQHRLMACVESCTPIDSEIIFNVSNRAFSTMDCGKARTAADVLSTIGVKNSGCIAAALRIVFIYLHSPDKAITIHGSSTHITRMKLSNDEIINTYNDIDRIIGDKINTDTFTFLNDIIVRMGKLRILRTGGFFGAVIITMLEDFDKGMGFFDDIVSGLFVSANAPAKKVNELGYTRIKFTFNNGTSQSIHKLGLYIKGFNLWIANKEVAVLKLGRSGSIQRIKL